MRFCVTGASAYRPIGRYRRSKHSKSLARYLLYIQDVGGSVAEWLACWTRAQKGPGSNRSRDAVGQQS